MFEKDPLFGVVVILSIIMLVALADFWRVRVGRKKTAASLNNLAKSYDFTGADAVVESSIKNGVELMLRLGDSGVAALLFVAKSFEKSGQSQEAIKIYLNILEKFSSNAKKIEVLEALGGAYQKAGFLQRAKDIYLQILNAQPRNMPVLVALMRTYESLGEYKNAIDALECIEELHRLESENARIDAADDKMGAVDKMSKADKTWLAAFNLNKAYLSFLARSSESGGVFGGGFQNGFQNAGFQNSDFQNNGFQSDRFQSGFQNATFAQNLDFFLRLKKEEPRLEKLVLKHIKKYDLARFWELSNALSHIAAYDMVDVFWAMPIEQVDFSKITNPAILEIYLARGYLSAQTPLPAGIQAPSKCTDFELEKKRLLDLHSDFSSTLSFEYRCNGCKNIFPFDQARCPACGDLLNASAIYKVQLRSMDEKSYSLL